MDIETYRDYCLSKKGVFESCPFPMAPDVLVFKVADKIFSTTDISTFESISIKCPPDLVDELKAEYDAVVAPSHFSKKHWNFVLMDDSVPDEKIFEWIDTSYELALAKVTKKLRAELGLL